MGEEPRVDVGHSGLLDLYREQIDRVDRGILDFLKERFALTNQIGKLKKELSLDIIDKSREEKLMEQYQEWAKELGLDPKLVKNIFELIISKSRKKQSF